MIMSERSASQTPLGALEFVREGMVVNDPAGRPFGTVELVRMGDPEAASDRGNDPNGGSFLDGIALAFGAHDEPHVPGELRDVLLRVGFVKVESLGPHHRTWYARGDQIAQVAQRTVTLGVPPTDLIDERDA
jgi:hypothetical protein